MSVTTSGLGTDRFLSHISICSFLPPLTLSCCLPCIPWQVLACCAAEWRIPTGHSHLTVSHISSCGSFFSMYSWDQLAELNIFIDHNGLNRAYLMQVWSWKLADKLVCHTKHTYSHTNERRLLLLAILHAALWEDVMQAITLKVQQQEVSKRLWWWVCVSERERYNGGWQKENLKK